MIGFGRLQWMLYLVLGLAMMGDGIELLMMAYILPGAEQDFCMTAPMKGWLGKSERYDNVMKVNAKYRIYTNYAGGSSSKNYFNYVGWLSQNTT